MGNIKGKSRHIDIWSALSHFSHVQLCDPMDCSPPGSSVQGILQARILEWVAVPSSRASSRPSDRTHVSLHLLHRQVGSLPLTPPGKFRHMVSSFFFLPFFSGDAASLRRPNTYFLLSHPGCEAIETGDICAAKTSPYFS